VRHKQKRAVKYKNKNSDFLHMPKEGFNAFHHTLVQSVGAQVKGQKGKTHKYRVAVAEVVQEVFGRSSQV
jgi:hypothetical protein